MSNRNNPKKPDLSQYLKHGLAIEQVEQMKTYFGELADKQTGLINACDIREILQSFGQKARDNEVHYTLQVVLDTYGQASMDGKIDFQQFLYLVTSNVSDKDTRTDMKRLFNLYDDGRVGYITKDKLRHIADEYGIWVTDDQLKLMIQTANISQDGMVTEEQFYELMTMQTKIRS